jgi:1-acyl-sn-glycerol-3-phosphate acyltransferase
LFQPDPLKKTAMPLIRSILHMLFLVVTVIPWALFAVFVSLFVSSTTMYWICARWLKLSVDSGNVILGIQNRVTGMENLPTGEKSPAVLLVKHQSTWETLTMPAIMPHPLAYVFKKELLLIPFFGWAMARMDMIHIDRSQGKRAFAKVVEQGKRLMEEGTWVIMFPEGNPARAKGRIQVRRHPFGDPGRRAGDPDCRDLGQVLAAQGLHQDAGHRRYFHRQAHSQRGPAPRRTDVGSRELDRGRDAPARSRGLRDQCGRAGSGARRAKALKRHGTAGAIGLGDVGA